MIAQEGRCFLLLQLQQCLDIGAITTSVWPGKKRTFPVPRVHLPAQRGLDHLPRDPEQSTPRPSWTETLLRSLQAKPHREDFAGFVRRCDFCPFLVTLTHH